MVTGPARLAQHTEDVGDQQRSFLLLAKIVDRKSYDKDGAQVRRSGINFAREAIGG